MKRYEEDVLNAMDNAKVNIIAQLNRAYESGYEDAKSELGKNVIDLAHKEIDRAYQRGLNEAWEVAKKIVAIYKRHELQNMGFKCDGSDYNFSIIVEDYTAQEVIAKIKEYEEKQKQDEAQGSSSEKPNKSKSICSVCGTVFYITVPEEYSDREVSYCPMCGCPMEIER